MSSFVHLHTHSEFSLLDGAARVKDMVRKAADQGMPALAVTDHGVLYGTMDFYKEAKKQNIKPILGFEAYMARRSRLDRTPRLDDSQNHLVLLARNDKGYRNLLQLSSRGFLEGFYYKPRIDRELLEKYHEGLIGLSACMAGEIPELIMSGKLSEAEGAAGYYSELLGKDNFYLEIQDHGLPEQQLINREMLNIARKMQLPVVATNDVHYLEKDDAFIHDVLLCIQTGKNINDNDRMRFSGAEFYFKTAEEMAMLFREVPEALTNTLEIAERCNLEFSFDKFYLPAFDIPSGDTPENFLRILSYQFLPLKYPNYDEKVVERLDYELGVINSMGFAGYFLIVHDLVSWAKKRGIAVGPGRGSAAGSLVSYLLSITTIDPLAYGLIFERFLNPERVSMPDIDIDFCFERRDEVIDYIVGRYGHDRVAQIITFGTMAARAAIRDVGRVLEYSYAETDRIVKMIPTELGITLDRSLQISPDLINLYEQDYQVRKLVDTARALEGMPRHHSVHAAGVVIGNDELTNLLPLQKTTDGHVVTQFTKETVEEIGLLKMDILGLRTLTVIQRTVEILEKTRGIRVVPEELPLDDPGVYELLSNGDSIGIFQLESDGLRRLLTDMKPDRFEDLIAVIALYRPGPLGSGMVEDFIKCKNGRQEISYVDPMLQPVLEETYGVILYQEQVMQVASELAAFSMGEADGLRRAMGKKKPQEIEKQRDKFVNGAIINGLLQDKASYIFDLMEHFAGYGFNKSHSAAYAMISYQTAYLKYHYPVEYMTAFLSSVIDNQDRVVFYIRECQRMGIKILPPDINESFENFTVAGDRIRFGLGAIKGVGEAAYRSIIAARKEAPFVSLFDFCRRVDLHQVNKRVMENLALAGCFDSLGTCRREALQVMDEMLEIAAGMRAAEESNQLSLFEVGEQEPEEPKPRLKGEFPVSELLTREKEVLGFYVSGNPLEEYRQLIPFYSSHQIEETASLRDGTYVRLVGMVSELSRKISRKGEPWASFTLEDLTGKVEAVIFSAAYRQYGPDLTPDSVISLEGKLTKQDELPKVISRAVTALTTGKPDVHVRLNGKKDNGLKDQLLEILAHHPGEAPVYLHLGEGRTIELDHRYWVTVNSQLRSQLERVFGKSQVVVNEGR
ncbi:MAG: DNA polymerase III subunit alpha [Syntrophomonadaceae bacterium]|nr:DNA polymerase III subunit alpha [Syntrophomonadaceae bacterium]